MPNFQELHELCHNYINDHCKDEIPTSIEDWVKFLSSKEIKQKSIFNLCYKFFPYAETNAQVWKFFLLYTSFNPFTFKDVLSFMHSNKDKKASKQKMPFNVCLFTCYNYRNVCNAIKYKLPMNWLTLHEDLFYYGYYLPIEAVRVNFYLKEENPTFKEDFINNLLNTYDNVIWRIDNLNATNLYDKHSLLLPLIVSLQQKLEETLLNLTNPQQQKSRLLSYQRYQFFLLYVHFIACTKLQNEQCIKLIIDYIMAHKKNSLFIDYFQQHCQLNDEQMKKMQPLFDAVNARNLLNALSY